MIQFSKSKYLMKYEETLRPNSGGIQVPRLKDAGKHFSLSRGIFEADLTASVGKVEQKPKPRMHTNGENEQTLLTNKGELEQTQLPLQDPTATSPPPPTRQLPWHREHIEGGARSLDVLFTSPPLCAKLQPKFTSPGWSKKVVNVR